MDGGSDEIEGASPDDTRCPASPSTPRGTSSQHESPSARVTLEDGPADKSRTRPRRASSWRRRACMSSTSCLCPACCVIMVGSVASAVDAHAFFAACSFRRRRSSGSRRRRHTQIHATRCRCLRWKTRPSVERRVKIRGAAPTARQRVRASCHLQGTARAHRQAPDTLSCRC